MQEVLFPTLNSLPMTIYFHLFVGSCVYNMIMGKHNKFKHKHIADHRVTLVMNKHHPALVPLNNPTSVLRLPKV